MASKVDEITVDTFSYDYTCTACGALFRGSLPAGVVLEVVWCRVCKKRTGLLDPPIDKEQKHDSETYIN